MMNELKSMLRERRIAPALTPIRKMTWYGLAICLFPLPWLLLFVYAGPLLRRLDPGAAVMDMGILSVLILTLLSIGLFTLASRLLLILLLQPVRQVATAHFETTLNKLTLWQRSLVYTGSYVALLYAFVGVFIALLS